MTIPNKEQSILIKMATFSVGVGLSSLQHKGITRSLTADFISARQTLRRFRDRADVSDSEDVRWVRSKGLSSVWNELCVNSRYRGFVQRD